MPAALVVTEDESLGPRVQRELTECSIFTATGTDEALRMLRITETDLVIVDGDRPAQDLAQFVSRARLLYPSAVVVCLHSAEEPAPADTDVLDAVDFLLLKPFTSRNLAAVLRQADAKRGLLLELSALRARQAALNGHGRDRPAPAPDPGSPTVAAVVRQLGKTHSAGLDLPRVLESFLDAAHEMLNPSRAVLLLPTEGAAGFGVAAHRGLPLHLVRSVRLPVDTGLPRWLEAHGRVLQVTEAEAPGARPVTRDAARDLLTLKATLAVPLLTRGELVAILTLGRRVTGQAYSPRDLETLFELGGHVAANIREIQLQQR